MYCILVLASIAWNPSPRAPSDLPDVRLVLFRQSLTGIKLVDERIAQTHKLLKVYPQQAEIWRKDIETLERRKRDYAKAAWQDGCAAIESYWLNLRLAVGTAVRTKK